jgi:imidazolonepropionase
MLLINATLAAMDGSPAYGLVEQGAVAIEKGLIAWVGRDDAIPAQLKAGEVIDLEGRLVTPALIDCHTHVVHGGNRAREFEMRLEGASMRRSPGPGAASSRPSRHPCRHEDELALRRPARVDALIAEGVATVEIKSGYGLDQDTELKMLRVARAVGKGAPVRVSDQFSRRPCGAARIQGRCRRLYRRGLPSGARSRPCRRLVDAVDGFCEGIAFTPEQIARVFDKAQGAGHAGQTACRTAVQSRRHALAAATARCPPIMSNMPRQRMPPRWRKPARSPSSARRLLHLARNPVLPPVQAFREARRADGGGHRLQPRLVADGVAAAGMNMACTLFRLTPEEALAGVTRNAARALGSTDCGRSRRACAPTLRSGMSSIRRSWPTASASTRCKRAFLEARMTLTLTPVRPRCSQLERSGAPAMPVCSTQRPPRHRGRGGPGSQGGRRR